MRHSTPARRPTLRLVLALLVLGLVPLLSAGDPLPILIEASRPPVRFTARTQGIAVQFLSAGILFRRAGRTVALTWNHSLKPDPEPVARAPGVVNYLIGDPRDWRTGVPTFTGVRYRGLYPGVDLEYRDFRGRLKSEYTVAPFADPAAIELRFSAPVRIDESGALIAGGPGFDLREPRPIASQDGRPVNVAWRVIGRGGAGFAVGAYDRSRPLVIDPALGVSTYLGSSGIDIARAAGSDNSSNIFVAGYTDSADLPVVSAVQSSSGGAADAFVAKLNSTGATILYWTYLGGIGDDRIWSMAVTPAGNAIVGGWTTSVNFPVIGGVQPAFAGVRDGFVSMLTTNGTAFLYSTYLGGAGDDSVNGVAVDSGGAAYVTGSTLSTNFPVAAPYQAARAGGQDAFVVKLNGTGSTLVYSTYLGGTADDRGAAIAVDATGAAYVAGTTASSTFPKVAPLQVSIGGSVDAFVTKVNPAGSALVYSTYLGGSGSEWIEAGRAIAVDSSGQAYVGGRTPSLNFPVSFAYQGVNRGGLDGFLAKFNAAGSAFIYSTYFGASSTDEITAVAADSGGRAFAAGYSSSSDFPLVSATQASPGGSLDAFLARFTAAGDQLLESTLIGGADADAAYGLALDTVGRVVIAGSTSSGNFPTASPVQSGAGGAIDAFVARLTFSGTPGLVSITPASGSGPSPLLTLIYSDTAGAADLATADLLIGATATPSTGCWIRYTQATHTLQLRDDTDSAWIGPVTPATPAILSNGRCAVQALGSSAIGIGANLTVQVSVFFATSFSGAKNLFMQAQTDGGDLAAWTSKGTWTVPSGNTPPAGLSVSPNSGSAASQVFSFHFFDANGATDIRWIEAAIAASLTNVNSCYLHWDRVANTIQLARDDGADWVGSRTLGVAGTLTNSQCIVDAGASSAAVSGLSITLNLSITFRAAYTGSKNVFLQALDFSSLAAGWTQRGTFTALASNEAPTSVSVAPAAGSGYTQTFTFVTSDVNGSSDIRWAEYAINATLTSVASCYLHYDRQTNALQLANDAGSDWVATRVLGSTFTLQNSRCAIDIVNATATLAGNQLTVVLPITFKGLFTGAKNIYMQAMDFAGLPAGWTTKGAYTVVASGLDPPQTISVTPSSGSGLNATFALLYSDAAGFANLRWVEAAVATTVTSVNSCYIHYDRVANLIYLANNPGTDWTGAITPGTAQTTENSQCRINATGSSSASSGNNFTFTVSITFKVFAGAKNVYMQALNNAGVPAGWSLKGAWTVP